MKILFADDEPLTLQYLEKILNWESLNIELMGSASNGSEALKYFEKEIPDIVITDIRMPVLDGISLIEKIRSYSQRCRIIVLSAYSDFEYARKVFSSGISGYLVKPVDEDKLLELITNIIEELRVDAVELEKSKFSQNLAAETLLWEQITKPERDEVFIEKFSKLDRIPDLSRFQLLSITLSDHQLSRNAVISCLVHSKSLLNHSENYLIRSGVSNWLLLLEKEVGSVEVATIRKEFQTNLDPSTYLTVSGTHHSASQLSTAFNEIQYLNTLRYYATESSYVFFRTRTEHISEEEIRLNDEIEIYFSKIKEQNFQAMLSYISELNEKLIRKYESDIRGYQNFWTLFVILIRTWLNKMKSQIQIPIMLKDFNSKTFISCKNSSEILTFIEDLNREILSTPVSVPGDAMFSPIKDVKEYIHKSYGEKLTLENIASHFAMSKNYLCRLFKDSAGCTLWDYLTMIRIEHAKELLEKTAKGTGEIAMSVGYDNQGYFSSVFKKKTGTSPKQYRDKISNKVLYP